MSSSLQQRATSLDQLTANQHANPNLPPQQVLQGNATDKELVQDILQEMQTGNSGTISSDASNEAGLARQLDSNVHNESTSPTHDETPQSPSNAKDLPQSLQHVPEKAKLTDPDVAQGLSTQNNQKPVKQGFNLIEFVKTILLFMILYIVLSHSTVQSLLCKISAFCTPVSEGALAQPSLNFMGTVTIAFIAGLIMAAVQAFV